MGHSSDKKYGTQQNISSMGHSSDKKYETQQN
jgi:hypothetical protein